MSPFAASRINLSKSTKLKELEFRFPRHVVSEVAAILNTITFEHKELERVSIHLPFGALDIMRGEPQRHQRLQWEGLDNALLQLLKWHPNCTKIVWYNVDEAKESNTRLTSKHIERFLKGLLPYVMEHDRGNIVIELAVVHRGLTWFMP